MASTSTSIVERLGGMLKLGLELLLAGLPRLGRSPVEQAERPQCSASQCRRCDAPSPMTYPLLRTRAGQRLLQPRRARSALKPCRLLTRTGSERCALFTFPQVSGLPAKPAAMSDFREE